MRKYASCSKTPQQPTFHFYSLTDHPMLYEPSFTDYLRQLEPWSKKAESFKSSRKGKARETARSRWCSAIHALSESHISTEFQHALEAALESEKRERDIWTTGRYRVDNVCYVYITYLMDIRC
jgi:hypothetical protein